MVQNNAKIHIFDKHYLQTVLALLADIGIR